MATERDPVRKKPVTPFLQADGSSRIDAGFAPGGPVEYRPNEVNVDLRAWPDGPGAGNAEEIVAALARVLDGDLDPEQAKSVELLDFEKRRVARTGFVSARVALAPGADLLAVVGRANAELGGAVLSPNTVFRIAGVVADPMRFASTFWADPMRFASMLADPMRFASMFGDPMRFANSSTARPAGAPITPSTTAKSEVVVAILDTGHNLGMSPAAADPDEVDLPHLAGTLRDTPDVNKDEFLDIAAGHSTFIRTIIERGAAPGAFWMRGVIANDGDGAESDIAVALEDLHDDIDRSGTGFDRLIVNLSFSGYYLGDREPPRVAAAIRALTDRGAVVVAAAGNDGECRKKYPAAMPEVISVGSVGPCGPSYFSNHGPWVDVSAPGEDLVSRFFDRFDGAYEPEPGSTEPDIDEFSGWAMWSGTSFSTAAVVAVIASNVARFGCSAKEAAELVVTQPGLFRLTDYGVIVNHIF